MTSFGVTNIMQKKYMQTFKWQKQIYYRSGSLLPLSDADHTFLQIYFMENTNYQIYQRCQFNTDTKREIVAALQALFDQHNKLIRLFRIVLERMSTNYYNIVVRADETPIGQHVR